MRARGDRLQIDQLDTRVALTRQRHRRETMKKKNSVIRSLLILLALGASESWDQYCPEEDRKETGK